MNNKYSQKTDNKYLSTNKIQTGEKSLYFQKRMNTRSSFKKATENSGDFNWFNGKKFSDIKNTPQYLENAKKLSPAQLQIYLNAVKTKNSNPNAEYQITNAVPDLATTDISQNPSWYVPYFIDSFLRDEYYNQFNKDWMKYVPVGVEPTKEIKQQLWADQLDRTFADWNQKTGGNYDFIWNPFGRQGFIGGESEPSNEPQQQYIPGMPSWFDWNQLDKDKQNSFQQQLQSKGFGGPAVGAALQNRYQYPTNFTTSFQNKLSNDLNERGFSGPATAAIVQESTKNIGLPQETQNSPKVINPFAENKYKTIAPKEEKTKTGYWDTVKDWFNTNVAPIVDTKEKEDYDPWYFFPKFRKSANFNTKQSKSQNEKNKSMKKMMGGKSGRMGPEIVDDDGSKGRYFQKKAKKPVKTEKFYETDKPHAPQMRQMSQATLTKAQLRYAQKMHEINNANYYGDEKPLPKNTFRKNGMGSSVNIGGSYSGTLMPRKSAYKIDSPRKKTPSPMNGINYNPFFKPAGGSLKRYNAYPRSGGMASGMPPTMTGGFSKKMTKKPIKTVSVRAKYGC